MYSAQTTVSLLNTAAYEPPPWHVARPSFSRRVADTACDVVGVVRILIALGTTVASLVVLFHTHAAGDYTQLWFVLYLIALCSKWGINSAAFGVRGRRDNGQACLLCTIFSHLGPIVPFAHVAENIFRCVRGDVLDPAVSYTIAARHNRIFASSMSVDAVTDLPLVALQAVLWSNGHELSLWQYGVAAGGAASALITCVFHIAQAMPSRRLFVMGLSAALCDVCLWSYSILTLFEPRVGIPVDFAPRAYVWSSVAMSAVGYALLLLWLPRATAMHGARINLPVFFSSIVALPAVVVFTQLCRFSIVTLYVATIAATVTPYVDVRGVKVFLTGARGDFSARVQCLARAAGTRLGRARSRGFYCPQRWWAQLRLDALRSQEQWQQQQQRQQQVDDSAGHVSTHAATLPWFWRVLSPRQPSWLPCAVPPAVLAVVCGLVAAHVAWGAGFAVHHLSGHWRHEPWPIVGLCGAMFPLLAATAVTVARARDDVTLLLGIAECIDTEMCTIETVNAYILAYLVPAPAIALQAAIPPRVLPSDVLAYVVTPFLQEGDIGLRRLDVDALNALHASTPYGAVDLYSPPRSVVDDGLPNVRASYTLV